MNKAKPLGNVRTVERLMGERHRGADVQTMPKPGETLALLHELREAMATGYDPVGNTLGSALVSMGKEKARQGARQRIDECLRAFGCGLVKWENHRDRDGLGPQPLEAVLALIDRAIEVEELRIANLTGEPRGKGKPNPTMFPARKPHGRRETSPDVWDDGGTA